MTTTTGPAALMVPGLFHAFDASIPPARPYPGCQAVLGYLGGPTPHVWTLEEWLRFADLRQAPIWLYNPARDASAEGRAAVAAAKALGWRAFARVRRVIWLDMELTEDPAWIAAWAAAVREGGFEPGHYRSLSSFEATGDPGIAMRWIAAWDGAPVVEQLARVDGHQYRANVPWLGTQVDLDVFDGTALAAFGHGPRRLVA
jgi:hypothetical protein